MQPSVKTLAEVNSLLSAVIDLQKEAIDELFRTLAMHLSADELDGLPALNKINMAVKLMQGDPCGYTGIQTDEGR